MTEKFEFIDAEYAAYLESEDIHVPSVVKMCRWMEVSRSGFYEWRNAPELLRYPGDRARRLDHHLHGFILEFR